ncbi:hypothetical protein ACI7YT_12730 [Microbacterium sp. M]|uniref:hypothetical protein n=1 Tax=Microbacterium sp. M TaxID=3377125 RepID=UPI0038680FE1
MGVHIREFDGARGVDVEVAGDFVVIEVASHAYAFDRSLFLHGIKKALGIAFVVEDQVPVVS